jgi:hypothetical protein
MARSANKLEIIDQLNALVLYGQADRFSSRQDTVNWADNIASLLRSAESDYYDSFLEYMPFITNPDQSLLIQKSNVQQMIKIAKQAAYELQYDISGKERIAKMVPDKITLSWFIHHAPLEFWMWLAVAALLAFVVGLYVGKHWVGPNI